MGDKSTPVDKPTAVTLTIPLESSSPEAIKALQVFAKKVVNANAEGLDFALSNNRTASWTLFGMYVGMFLVGFGTAIAAIVRGFTATNMPEAITAVAFLGLTAASFFTLFLVRPLESLGRDGIFSSWLLGAMNTYWTRVMLISDPAKGDAELKDANAELMGNLSALADKYSAAIGKYPPLEDAGGKRPSR